MAKNKVGNSYTKTVRCRLCKEKIEMEIVLQEDKVEAEQGDYFCYGCGEYVCPDCRAKVHSLWGKRLMSERNSQKFVEIVSAKCSMDLKSLATIALHNGDFCKKCVGEWESGIVRAIPRTRLSSFSKFKWVTKAGRSAYKAAVQDIDNLIPPQII